MTQEWWLVAAIVLGLHEQAHVIQSEWEMKIYAMPIHTLVTFYHPGKAFYTVQSLIQILTSWRGTDSHEHLQLQMAHITPITSSVRGFIYSTSVFTQLCAAYIFT